MEVMWVMLIPIVAVIMWGLPRVFAARAAGGVRELQEEVRALRVEVERLRADGGPDAGIEGRLLELEERVDFAERLLARGQEQRSPGA